MHRCSALVCAGLIGASAHYLAAFPLPDAELTNMFTSSSSAMAADHAHKYASGLRRATQCAITSAPVAWAQILRNYAAALATLGRYEDGLCLLDSARMLARSRYIEADYAYYLCRQAAKLGDWETAARHAEACVHIDPDYSPFAFHFLALREYAHRHHRKAIDIWLDGLYGVPLPHAEAYLDASMGFWKHIAEDQVDRLYDTLTMLAANAQAGTTTGLARILAERVKLQTLYPARYPTHNPRAVIACRGRQYALTGFVEQVWQPALTPEWAVVSALLVDDTHEQMFNTALAHLAQGDDPAARTIITDLLDEYELLRQSSARIEGWPLAFAVDVLCLTLDEPGGTPAWHSRVAACARRAEAFVEAGTAPVGSFWFLLQLHIWRLTNAATHGDEHTMLDALDAMQALVPGSVYLPMCSAFRRLMHIESPADAQRIIEGFINVPNPLPDSRFWVFYARFLEEYGGGTRGNLNPAAERAIISALLDGLENSYRAEARALVPRSSARSPSLVHDPLFGELATHLDATVLSAQHLARVHAFLHRYGVCIPAIPSQVPLIRDIVAWRARIAALRTSRPVDVTLICDATSRPDVHELWLWTDVHSGCVPMTATGSNNLWVASIVAPEGSHALRYGVYVSPGDVPHDPDLAAQQTVRVIDAEEAKMRIGISLPSRDDR